MAILAAREEIMFYRQGSNIKYFVRSYSAGQVLPLMLSILAMGAIFIVPFLSQTAAGVKGFSRMRDLNVEGYTTSSGIEHARWRLQFESGFADSINQSSPAYTYGYNINGSSTNITINWVSPMPSPTPTPPPGPPGSDRVSVEYSITPSSLLAGQTTIVTVTITVRNLDNNPIKFEEIGDLLPSGFTYIAGTASGFTASEPGLQMVGGRQELTWAFGTPHPTLDPGEFIQQIFQASATPPEGVYYNEPWVEFVPGSVGTVSGGGTIMVAQYRKYDVMSKVGYVTIKARLGKNDINVAPLSWQR